MKEMTHHSQLTRNEEQIISQLQEKHQLSAKQVKVLVKYYLHFTKYTTQLHSTNNHSVKSLAEVSLIFTEKSNFYKTLQGRNCPGICFSLNDILKNKSHDQIRLLTRMCKEIIEKVKFRQNILKQDVLRLVQQIDQGVQEAMLFEKLCKLFFDNTLQVSKEIKSYKQSLIIFSWYLYIDSKHTILPRNPEFSAKKLLIISILQTIIFNSLAHITPLILQKPFAHKNKKETLSSILSTLLGESKTSPQELYIYQEISQSFDQYFDHLVEKQVIKSFTQERFDYLEQKSLEANLRKIDRKISKEIQSNQIDLRKFIDYQEKQADVKQHKRTAIEDKLIIKHKNNHSKTIKTMNTQEKKFKSHRVLDLDHCQMEQLSSSSVISQSTLHFPSSLILEAPRMSVPLLHQLSEQDELSLFILQKTRPYITELNKYEPTIIRFIEENFNKLQEITTNGPRKSLSSRSSHVFKSENIYQSYELYRYLTECAWATPESMDKEYILEETNSMHSCLLTIAMGIILSSQQNSFEQDYIVKLLSLQQEIDVIDLFYAVIYIQSMGNLPDKLKKLLSQALKTLINEKIWSDEDFISEILYIQEQLSESLDQSEQKMALSCVLSEVSLYIQERISMFRQQLEKRLNVNLSEWSQKSLLLALTIVTHSPQLLYNRYLDQLILCSLYGTSKLLKLNIKFHELITVYRSKINGRLLERVVMAVKKNFLGTQNDETVTENNSNIEWMDIIQFYNIEFIKHLNYGSDIAQDKEKLQIMSEMINYAIDFDNQEDSPPIYTSPFRTFQQQALLSSPKLQKSKSTSNALRSFHSTEQKQNSFQTSNRSINITLENSFSSTGDLELFSVVSQPNEDETKNSKNIYINFEFSKSNQNGNGGSRNPTRIKERKTIEEKEAELCLTQKPPKHPIFTQLRDNHPGDIWTE